MLSARSAMLPGYQRPVRADMLVLVSRPGSRLWAMVALAPLAACGDPTQVLVWAQVAPGSEIARRARAMHVVVLDEDGQTVLDEMRSLVGDPPEQTLPASISLVPKNDD